MDFREVLESEPVQSLPIREAISIRSGTIVRAAIAEMRTNSLGCAVIVGHDDVPSGIFTERSIIELLKREVSLDSCTVGEFADPSFLAMKRSEPISQVWDVIKDSATRFVCVTDEKGKLVGITGQRGLAEFIADCFASQVTVQRLGSTPWLQEREGA